MDQERIGRFIQELRKEKNLTQKDLADKIGISDKAISKWENGRGMPDTSLLEPLCNELSVSVNELLAAEKLPPEEYALKAEENIMELLQSNKKNRERGLVQIIIGIAILMVSFVFMLISVFGAKSLGNTLVTFIDPPTIIYLLLACTAAVFISGSRNLRAVLKTIKAVIIPAGLIEMIVGLVAIWLGTYASDESGVLLYLQSIHTSYFVAVIGLLYALIIFIIVTVWLRALENRDEKRSGSRESGEQ